MTTIVFDTETYLIQPGRLAPRLVVTSLAELGQDGATLHLRRDTPWERILGADLIVGHNVAFDLAVYAQNGGDDIARMVWQAYLDGRVTDTMLRDQLRTNADGSRLKSTRFGLSDLVSTHLGVRMEGKSGPDVWRMRYAELDGVPVEDWPHAASEYATLDAVYTAQVYEAQARAAYLRRGRQQWPDELWQARKAWTFHLMSAHGMRTSPARVEETAHRLASHVRQAFRDVERMTAAEGAAPLVSHGSKLESNIRERVEAAYNATGRAAPLTETGKTSIKTEVLRESGDPVLETLAGAFADAKEVTTYLPVLRLGAEHPINPRFTTLLETGRTSASHNAQTLPRRPGVRECYEARPGHVFVNVDLDKAELVALAQVALDWFGRSALAELIQAGIDPHLDMAAQIVGISLEEAEALKAGDVASVQSPSRGNLERGDLLGTWRQAAKGANFGLPGGLGVETFQAYCKALYGVELSEAEAHRIRETWRDRFPELSQDYHGLIGQWTRGDLSNPLSDWYVWQGMAGNGEFDLIQPRTGRVRGSVRFTNGCNTPFQGLVADAATRAQFWISLECYLGEQTCDHCCGTGYAADRRPLHERGPDILTVLEQPPVPAWPGHLDAPCPHCGGTGRVGRSPLYGSRVVNFLHDEIMAEVREENLHSGADRIRTIMERELQVLTPDVPATAEAQASRYWTKAAQALFDGSGNPIPLKEK